MRLRQKLPGFTLIELVITVAIIGLMAGIAVPTAELVLKRDREHELRLALREIRRAIDTYKQAWDDGRIMKTIGESGYPPSLKVLVDGVVDARSPEHTRIYFLRRVPTDPLSADAEVSPEQSWGLRSYASEPDEPAEGKDVFDIYSKSPDTGLNGIPYRKW